MICPLLTNGVISSANKGIITGRNNLTLCREQECAWWIKEERQYKGECAIKRIALGKRVHYTGPR